MNMNKKIIILACIIIFAVTKSLEAQDRSGDSWVFGGGGLTAKFADTNSNPIVSQYWPSLTIPHGPYFIFFWTFIN
jgi:hypothetical protein